MALSSTSVGESNINRWVPVSCRPEQLCSATPGSATAVPVAIVLDPKGWDSSELWHSGRRRADAAAVMTTRSVILDEATAGGAAGAGSGYRVPGAGQSAKNSYS
jgi:hypothetical protein